MNVPAPEHKSKSENPFHGAFWTLAMRWSDRLVGIISTLILARLLLPADFGLFALASITVAFADALLDLGVHLALIQHPNPQRDDYDSAWTLRIIQSVLAMLGVMVAARPLAELMHEPQLAALLPWLAAIMLVGSLENIATIDFQRHQRFDRDFQFFFAKKIAGFVITITLALTLRSYWALAAGSLAQRLTGVLASYSMHPYRPRLNLARAMHIWHFSKWVLAQNIGGVLEQKLDKAILGTWGASPLVGAYSVADDIATMPSTELLAPLNRTLLPTLAAQMGHPQRLIEAFLLAYSVQCLITFPIATGIALVAEPTIHLLLGPKWLAAVPILQLLALSAVPAALSGSSRYLLLAAGQSRVLAMTTWLQIILFALVALSLPSHAGAAAIAATRVGATAVAALLILVLVTRQFPGIRGRQLARAVARPAIATGLMALAVVAAGSWWNGNGISALIGGIAVGATVYASCIFLLWHISGRPDGAERFVLRHARLVTI